MITPNCRFCRIEAQQLSRMELCQFHTAAEETAKERDQLLEALTELINVGDLRGDTQLPHPSDDPMLWSARMQEAWDVGRAIITQPITQEEHETSSSGECMSKTTRS